jgi:hypothetical protein
MFKGDDLEFDLNRQISSQRAFLVIIILSFIVASYTIVAANKIVDNAKNSTTFNVVDKAKNNSNPVKNINKNTNLNNKDMKK